MASYDDLDFEWSLLCKENECAAWTESGKSIIKISYFTSFSIFYSIVPLDVYVHFISIVYNHLQPYLRAVTWIV